MEELTFTYCFCNAEQTMLKREDNLGNLLFIPTDPGNQDYAYYLTSGVTADPYIVPDYPPLTPEEKLARSGLTVAELQQLLDL